MGKKAIKNLIIVLIFLLTLLLVSCNEDNQEQEPVFSTVKTTELAQEEMIKEYQVFIDPNIPEYMKAVLNHAIKIVLKDESHAIFDKGKAGEYDVEITLSEMPANISSPIVLVPVTNFYSFSQNIEYERLLDFWQGRDDLEDAIDIYWAQKEEEDSPVLVLSEESYFVLEKILGPHQSSNIQIIEGTDIGLSLQRDQYNFSIVFFADINPSLNLLDLDDMDVLDKSISNEDWPLSLFINFEGSQESLKEDIKKTFEKKVDIGRDVEKIATVNMTGVTALSRQIARAMDAQGVLYPAEHIADTLRDADITHISNEVPFKENCDAGKSGTVFCSKPEYFELLEYVGTDIIELTGNHVNDYGPEWFDKTIDLFDEAGIQYFGGGRDLEDARKPALFNIAENKIAFVGFNQFGPEYSWATEERAGSAPPEYEYHIMQVADLKRRGYNVIFTFQYEETYRYWPFDKQVEDFRKMLSEGADIVSGSQAHQPMGFEINENGFINYGLGNIFFGQALSEGTKQGIISKHIFYKNSHINTKTTTYIVENHNQPKIIDGDARIRLLTLLFEGSRFSEE